MEQKQNMLSKLRASIKSRFNKPKQQPASKTASGQESMSASTSIRPPIGGAIEKGDDEPRGADPDSAATMGQSTSQPSHATTLLEMPDVIITPASADESVQDSPEETTKDNPHQIEEETQEPAAKMQEFKNDTPMQQSISIPPYGSSAAAVAPEDREPDSPKPLMSATSGPLEDQPAMR